MALSATRARRPRGASAPSWTSSGAAFGIRAVPVTRARPRKVTASMVNSRVRLAGSATSTICPPTSAPMPMPRLIRVNWSAKACERVAAVEQRTIMVASAGWQVVTPAPNRNEETSRAGVPVACPKANAPVAASAAPASSTGRGP